MTCCNHNCNQGRTCPNRLLRNGATQTVKSKTEKFGPFKKAIAITCAAIEGPFRAKTEPWFSREDRIVILVCVIAALAVAVDLYCFLK